MANTVVLKGNGIKSEFLCKEAIQPGMLVDFVVDGGIIKIQKNTNGENLQSTAFAMEYEAFGKTIMDGYVAGNTAEVYFANAGDVVYVQVASGVALGDRLVCNGSGILRKIDTTSTPPDTGYGIVAVALTAATAVTMADSTTAYFARVLIS